MVGISIIKTEVVLRDSQEAKKCIFPRCTRQPHDIVPMALVMEGLGFQSAIPEEYLSRLKAPVCLRHFWQYITHTRIRKTMLYDGLPNEMEIQPVTQKKRRGRPRKVTHEI